ncbi:MAG TPA: hypothetical protein VHN11_07965 [Xanthobacteraceae bacterium]|jgi:hypothetical protein|nr:hypothetical protein [Xanthobacteraceae bacterium]
MQLAPHYNLKKFNFMAPQGPHMPITEPYVEIPPALVIRDNENALWTLGFDYSEAEWRGGKHEYDVVRNGRKTGEFARKIEFRKGKVRIWGSDGWRTWNGRTFV